MAFAGLKKEADRNHIIKYLQDAVRRHKRHLSFMTRYLPLTLHRQSKASNTLSCCQNGLSLGSRVELLQVFGTL